MHAPRLALTLPCLALLLALTACGDSSHADDPDTGTIPVGTVDEFSAYVAALEPDDVGEPFLIDMVLPPTSETAEPIEAG